MRNKLAHGKPCPELENLTEAPDVILTRWRNDAEEYSKNLIEHLSKLLEAKD